MKIEQTTIQKTFSVKYLGKLYCVDYVNSDGQTLALLNRNNWEIYDEDRKELQIYLFKKSSKKEKEMVKKNMTTARKLINYCVKHFNDFNGI